MSKISEIVESKGYKTFMKYVYGFGAAVVLVGALFKIQHYPGAAIMLVIGLLTEALIFFFSAFEPLHEELDWTLVYPELAGLSDEFDVDDDQVKRFDRVQDAGNQQQIASDEAIQQSVGVAGAAVSGAGFASLAKFDKMIEEAELDSDAIKNLGKGITKLSSTANELNDLSDTGVATKDFVAKMQSATESVSQLDTTYQKSSEVLKESVNQLSGSYTQTAESFNNVNQELFNAYNNFANTITKEIESIGTEGEEYSKKISSLNNNLSALNAVYELQINNGNEYVESSKQYFEGMAEMVNNINKTSENTLKLNSGVEQLEQNVASLNSIYGNMLSSLNFK